jgi:hypothetical protein
MRRFVNVLLMNTALHAMPWRGAASEDGSSIGC